MRFSLPLGLVLLLSLAVPGSTGAGPGDIGHEGSSYLGAGSAPTEPKPESKLWWNDGIWWASMWDRSLGSNAIFRLDLASQKWTSTGTRLDGRSSSRADVLWDATAGKLYVSSHRQSSAVRSGFPSYLYRFSYQQTTQSYSLDSGFPELINNYQTETLVIDKDTTGKLWATWIQDQQVYVNRTMSGDRTWGTPFVIPVSGVDVAADDISALVAFGNRIGLMWSNQLDSAMYFAEHVDGTADGSWQSSRTALQGPKTADDHINLATLHESGGRVFAVTKTSHSTSAAPLIMLLDRSPSSGDWSSHVFGTVADKHSRPIVVGQSDSRRLHVFATGPQPPLSSSGANGGTIYRKVSAIDGITFTSGWGEAVMQDADAANINDATSTKQAVNATTGLVVLASNDTTGRYWHFYDPLGGSTPSPSPTPTASPSPSPTPALSPSPSPSPTAAPSANPTLDPSPTAPPAGEVVFRSASFAANETATSVTVPRPPGAVGGDLLLASIDARGKPKIVAPSGWTLIREDQNGNTLKKATYYRIATNSEPATYRWSFSTSSAAAGGIMAYSGADLTQPIDAHGGKTTVKSTQITAPSVNATTPNTRLVGLFGTAIDTSIAPPTGLADHGQVASSAGNDRVTTGGSSATLTESGATGARVASASHSANNVGHLVLLRAATSTSSASPTPSPSPTPSASPTPTPTSTPTPSPTPSPSAPGSPNEITLHALADAYVNEAYPARNYGSATTLRVRTAAESFVSYLKFEVPSIGPDIASARLRLWVTDDSPDGGDVYVVPADWQEGTITWSNAPTTIGTVSIGQAGTVTTGGWVEITLDSSQVTAGTTLSIALRSASTNSAMYSSRESASNGPQLILVGG